MELKSLLGLVLFTKAEFEKSFELIKESNIGFYLMINLYKRYDNSNNKEMKDEYMNKISKASKKLIKEIVSVENVSNDIELKYLYYSI